MEQHRLPEPPGPQHHIGKNHPQGKGVKHLVQVSVEQAEAQRRGEHGKPVPIGPQPVQQQAPEHQLFRRGRDHAPQQQIQCRRVILDALDRVAHRRAPQLPDDPQKRQRGIVGQVQGRQRHAVRLKKAYRPQGRAPHRARRGRRGADHQAKYRNADPIDGKDAEQPQKQAVPRQAGRTDAHDQEDPRLRQQHGEHLGKQRPAQPRKVLAVTAQQPRRLV